MPDPTLLEATLRAAPGVEASAIDRAAAVAGREGERLDRVLLRLGLLDEAILLRAVCQWLGVGFLEGAGAATLDAGLVAELTPAYLSAQQIAPILGGADGQTNRPVFALADPANDALRREVEFHLGRPIERLGATRSTIRQLLASGTHAGAAEATGVSREAQANRDLAVLRSAETDGPVIRYVQEKLTDAVLLGASDIHFESDETGVAIRFRINGALSPQSIDPRIDPAAVLARLKVMAGVNVAERRLPQDGRFTAMIAGRTIDFRFSSLPTQWGESIVARVLDPKALRLGWDALGFDPAIAARIRAVIEQPNGLFLVTGPTGSGKTTTLYTAVAHLNTQARKIVTVEDPVEYNLPGIQQVQVNEAIGLTFARVLRGVLRHDPNVILIGEIRDKETAEIAVRAAQVGRMVLSTLHTSSAAGALPRLVDLGVPAFLARDVLKGVLGQNLVPVGCGACGGGGCAGCGGTGVVGRRLGVELV